MGEGHRLGHLHVGEARQNGVGVLFGLGVKRPLQFLKPAFCALDGAAHPQAEVGHHLVVARARGVQPSGGGADQFGQPRLDVEMDVLQLALEDEFARRDLLFDRVQTGQDLLAVILGDDAFGGQHAAMRPRPRKVLAARRLSKPIEGVISLMMSAGPDANRPPHILFVLISSSGDQEMTKKIIISLR